MSILKYEQKFLNEGYDFVIGIDEAGRGPLAGPVVASACVFKAETLSARQAFVSGHLESQFGLIRDSKKLSEKQREELYNFIHEHFHVGVGICDHKTIDRINILEATYLAMKKAIADLSVKLKAQSARLVFDKSKRAKPKLKAKNFLIIVDGNKIIPNLSIEQKAIVGGDNLVKSISAASIIAKVTRDRMMKKMHEKYPEYNFLKHKGYGTKEHMDMIRKHGACEIHRKSFRPFCS